MAFLGPKWGFANQIIVSNFGGGLDTLDSPAAIPSSFAQDILNVNIQPGGGMIYKRDGYGLFQTLNSTYSTMGVHGGYHFQQAGGNDVQIWASSGTLYGIVNDASPPVAIATGTVGATWQCTDSQGKAYCFSSSNDTPVQTDGTSANTIYFSSAPSGTMATFTPLQLVVAGVATNQNTIYISAQLAFNQFTPGILPSSPFIEPIASPGSRITHLAYYFGKLFWWKDQSFGYATFTGQNDWQLTIVSNQIGTLDNSDAFWNSSGFDSGTMFSGTAQANAYTSPGGIFFRGQDNHMYVYDGYYLTRISRPITPTVATASRKKANAWTQTTQGDFQNGVSTPIPNLSYTISPGDVIVSSFQAIENSSTQWTNGTVSNLTVNPSSITLNTNNSGTVTNPDFESSCSGNWTDGSSLWSCTGSVGYGMSPEHGSYMALISEAQYFSGTSITAFSFDITDTLGNQLSTDALTIFNDNTWRSTSFAPTTPTIGKRVKFRLHGQTGGTDYYFTTSDSYIWGGSISFYYNSVYNATAFHSLPIWQVGIDNITSGSSTITTGYYNSTSYNSGFSSSTYQLQASWSTSASSPTFALYTSTSINGPWATTLTSTGTNAIGNQYAKYASTISITGADITLPYLTSITMLSRSTGTYYSAVNNAPNFTSWGTFGVDDTNTGISSITYYTRASTSSFTIQSSTPSWVLQAKNGTVAASTGTYMQMRADFYLSAATETPTLNDFSFNWFEGSAADKAYITYFNDAIWFAVSSSSSSSTNNRIFYWDLLNGAWSIYDIPANGFLIENNNLYFGSPNGAYVYKYGGVTTDNGNNINSYWRSKAFLGSETTPNPDDLFVQKEFIQADFVLGESSTSLTYTYTLDSNVSTAFTMTAYDSKASLIQRNFLLPVGKIGKYYDFKVGDNSSAASWKVMGHRVIYNDLNWRPVTQ